MAQYRVLPRDDGHDYQSSWMVHKNGSMKSPHTTKEAAKNAARGYASDGDELVIHRQNGTIQKRVTVRDATPYDDDDNQQERGLYGTGTFETALGFDR